MKNKIITLTHLGLEGRFGNQIIHYLTGYGLAKKLGAELQIPKDWIGRKVFDINTPEISVLPKTQTSTDYIPSISDLENYEIIDLWGYFQYQTNLFNLNDIKEWLPIKKEWLETFPKTEDNLCVVHKRRGDYALKTHCYCCVTDQAFENAIEQAKIDSEIDLKIIYITEENPTIHPKCEALNLGFLPDWMKMINAKYLIRSNSTFSSTASWYNSIYSNGITFSPVVNDLIGWNTVPFVKGNHPKCCDSKYHYGTILTDIHL